jgi:hypothetical protein
MPWKDRYKGYFVLFKIENRVYISFEPKLNRYYIYKSRSNDSAWCKFYIEDTKLHEVCEEAKDPSTRLPLEQWKTLFRIANNRTELTTKEEVKKELAYAVKPPKYIDLKTPGKKKNSFEQIKQEFEHERKMAVKFLTKAEMLETNATIPPELQTHLENSNAILLLLLDQVQKMHAEFDTMALSADVSADLSTLMAMVSGLTATVGCNEENQFPDLWSGLDDIALNVKNDEFQKMHEVVTHVAGKIRIQDVDISTNNVRWTSLLKNWIPVIADNTICVKKLKLAVESFATASVIQMPLTHDNVNVILNKQPDDSQI